MKTSEDIKQTAAHSLLQAWETLLKQAENGKSLRADAYRLAFADPEFLLRRETRGLRFQLEMLKPDVGLEAAGVDSTIVCYGSARILDPEVARQRLQQAQDTGADAEQLKPFEHAVKMSAYYAAAREFGRLVATYSSQQKPENRLYICTGGGPGIMEAANRGARDAGEPTIGLNITLPHEQSANPYVSPELSFKFHYFALRKMHFMMRAKALVAFPGGFGTLDELFEVLTLIQTHKTDAVPVILYGSRFWQRLIDFEVLVQEGTISSQDLDLFKLVDDPKQAWQIIRDFYDLQALS